MNHAYAQSACILGKEDMKNLCFKWYANCGYNHLTHQLDKLLALC